MTIMSRDELIELVTVLEIKKNSSGFCVGEDIEKIEVFAGVKSVGRTEYYEALRNDIQVSIIFVVDPDDFRLSEREIQADGGLKKIKASKVVYDGTTYRIRRTYKNNFGMLEMTCSEVE